MLNKIIRFSLHNRLIVLIFSIILMGVGIYTTQQTEVDVFPDLNAPTVVVMTEAGGLAAEEVERFVTFPIETAVNGATDVRRVRSSSTNGFSVVWVEFEWGSDIYRDRQILSEKLSTISESLPPEVGKPVLGPQSSILGEVMIISMTADSTSMLDLRTLADRVVRPRLLATGGVSQVAVLGGDVKEYQIKLDPFRMQHYGVSLEEVKAAVQGMNQDLNGGILNEYGNEYVIRGVLSTSSTEKMGRVVVKPGEGTDAANRRAPVMLGDVATVVAGTKTPQMGSASYRGKSAVLLTVTKQPAVSTLELTDQLDRAMEDLQTSFPSDVKVSTDAFRQATFIESSIHNIQRALLEGSVFVVLVLFFFLANARTTLISLVTLPLSLLVTILVLHLMGLTLNTMSVGGMAIAIGSLVDDAIVDVENVWRHLRENRRLPEAERRNVLQVVYDASREVRMPILNSTLIIIVSFIPLFFLSGMEGRMLVPLGISFIISLFASTIVALTLTPVLCSYLLGDVKGNSANKEPRLILKLKAVYARSLDWSLSHRRVVWGITGGLLIVTLVGFFTLGRSFLPPFNEGSLTINISSLPGITLKESDAIGHRAEELLLTVPEIQTVARKTGRAELDEHALGVNVSEIEAPFILGDRSREEMMHEIRDKLSELNGVNIEIGQPISHRLDAMLSGTQAQLAIKLFGTNLTQMYRTGQQIQNAIRPVEGLVDLNVEQLIDRPQLRIIPRREVLASYGITPSQFAEFVKIALAGEVVSQVYDGGVTFDLTLKVDDSFRQRIDQLRDLPINTPTGSVPLQQVAEIRSMSGPNVINRENVQRKLVIAANVSGRDMRSAVEEVKQRISEQVKLPEGYHIEYGGQFESEESASRTLMLTSILSIAVIFLLLYQQFRSARQSALILLNLPLALIGGVFVLVCTSGELTIPSIIGFISLFGIATRGGMLLVSHYNQLEKEGFSVRNAVKKGSIDRLNPILMTALSSALALIPLALNGSLPGNEIQSPMAKVILGGLITSTFLNIYLIPQLYLIIRAKALKKKD